MARHSSHRSSSSRIPRTSTFSVYLATLSRCKSPGILEVLSEQPFTVFDDISNTQLPDMEPSDISNSTKDALTTRLSSNSAATKGDDANEASSESLAVQTIERSMQRLSIAPEPERLTSFVPPKNFGAVLDGKIFRSGYPNSMNFGFIAQLRIKTVLTLVEDCEDKNWGTFLADAHIAHYRVPIAANKDTIKIDIDHVASVMRIVLSKANTRFPLLIHCNQGKHRTGCIVGALRKCLGGDVGDILEEYLVYSQPKQRALDQEFLEKLDSNDLLTRAFNGPICPYKPSLSGSNRAPSPSSRFRVWLPREDS